jgi:hypothetical protein
VGVLFGHQANRSYTGIVLVIAGVGLVDGGLNGRKSEQVPPKKVP